MPAAPAIKAFIPNRAARNEERRTSNDSRDRDLRAVADDHPHRLGQAVAALQADVSAQEARLHAGAEVAHVGAGEEDRVLDLRRGDHDAGAEGRVGANVGVAKLGAGADDRGAPHQGPLEPGPFLDHHAPLDPRLDELALDAGVDVLEHEPVRLQHVGELPGVLPPTGDPVALYPPPIVDQALDRVGDLELAAPRRLDPARSVEDRRPEHVDTHEGEVGRRGRGFFDQSHHRVAGKLRHAVVLGVRDGREQDQRVWLRSPEGTDQIRDAVAQEVVAEVHHERIAAEELLGGQHRVREPERLGLGDVGDRDAEAGAIAGRGLDLVARLRRDDDPDLTDARGRQRLDAVEQHRLVRHRDELLRRGMGNRAEPGARPARQDQAFEPLHARRKASGKWVSGAAELAVVPARDPHGPEAHGDALLRLRLERGRVVLVDGDVGVARRQLLRELEDRLVVAVDLCLGFDLHAAQLGVLAARLDQQRRARFAFEVAHLLRLRVGVDPDLPLARHVPQRHHVRPAPRAEARDRDDALILDEAPLLLGLKGDDCAGARHSAAASLPTARLLITGGAGFVGANLAVTLAERHGAWEVIALDNLYRRGSELNLPRLADAGVEFVRGDVREPADLAAVAAPDAIVECSAEPSALAGLEDDAGYLFHTNLTGAFHCLELARQSGAALIFLSTSRVYPVEPLRSLAYEEGETRFELGSEQRLGGASGAGIAEEFPLAGARTLYGTTQLAAELLIA